MIWKAKHGRMATDPINVGEHRDLRLASAAKVAAVLNLELVQRK
jgi:hypothetical protein